MFVFGGYIDMRGASNELWQYELGKYSVLPRYAGKRFLKLNVGFSLCVSQPTLVTRGFYLASIGRNRPEAESHRPKAHATGHNGSQWRT